jgi:hypothetical protein
MEIMSNSNIVYDAKDLLNQLKTIEPKLKKEMLSEARGIAKKPQDLIKSAIPEVAPLSGMGMDKNPSGRTAWGAGKPANKVDFSTRATGSRRYAVTSLFRLIVASPMTAIADIAGKGSGVPRNQVTKPYAYKGGTRTHKVTNQGEVMINRLRERRKSNFVYPAVEDSLPSVEAELKLVVDKFARKINRKTN